MKKGRVLAASAAFLLLVAACAPPPTTQAPIHFLPSPSPTPTTALAVTPPSFHVGEVGVSYSPVTFTASGGLTPYKWSVTSGALPGGLALGTDGSISGTPTAGGDFSFTVAAADSGTQTATADAKISIAAPLTASLIPACAQYCNVELGCVNACGAFGSLSGGVGPYDFKVLGGDVPAGTSVSGFSLNGTFQGQTGWVQFTVQASDALGATTTISPKFWMYPHIALTGGTIPAGGTGSCPWPGYDPVNGTSCQAQFPYSGGTPNSGTISVSAAWASYTCNYTPACSNPPPMPTITVGGGVVTVTVPRGYASGTSGYKGTLTITLVNQDACAAGPVRCSASANVTITQASG